MKHFYLTTTFLLAFYLGKSQIYYQYFDGANTNPSNSLIIKLDTASTNIWQIGKPQKTLFNAASTPPKVIITDTINNIPSKNTSRFTFYILNPIMGPSILALRWKQKLDFNQGKDGGIVEYSTNSGNTWVNAFNNTAVYAYYGFQPSSKDTLPSGEFAFSGTDNVWRDIWLCMGPAIASLNDTIFMRFTSKSDSINTNNEGWMIDNMQANKTVMHPVKEISQQEYMNVYPSTTTNGVVNVEVKRYNEWDAIKSMELISAEGKVMEQYGENNLKTVIDISRHPTGLYHLKITTNLKSKTYSVFLEKK